MKSAVVVFPGINRERDMARTLRLVSGREPAMVWHADDALPAGTDLVVIPGGFSYGDYLRCGAIAARAPIMDAVRAFAAKGGLVLGVCNGFQILCEAGLLPGVLMRNQQLRFICRDVYLRVERSDTPFTRGYNAGQVIRVPVAHGEGNYIADGETIARLEGEGRVLFRYSSPDGMIDPNWNHNGAINAIAGIVNERGNVLGMMPHPENHVEAAVGGTDGRGLFAGLADHFRQAESGVNVLGKSCGYRCRDLEKRHWCHGFLSAVRVTGISHGRRRIPVPCAVACGGLFRCRQGRGGWCGTGYSASDGRSRPEAGGSNKRGWPQIGPQRVKLAAAHATYNP